MTAETDKQFLDRMSFTEPEDGMTERDFDRLFALARRGAGLTLDRQRHVVKEDHSHWIKETYSRYVPLLSPPAGETNE